MTKSNAKPYVISILLADGTPDGLRIAEKTSWNGRGVVCPRSTFAEEKGRDVFKRPGVYILLGPGESGDIPKAYIGEAGSIGERLEQHYVKKDFWTEAVFCVAKDKKLNTAHFEQLEARLLQMAKEAKRCKLDNQNQPSGGTLDDMDQVEADAFLEDMLLVLPVLGVSIFQKPAAPPLTAPLLYLKSNDIEGTGYESAQGFVVRKGSRARTQAVKSIPDYIADKRNDLVELGVLIQDGETFVLTQDYTFESPSSAAGVLLGSSVNGLKVWKNQQGKTLKEIQQAKSLGTTG